MKRLLALAAVAASIAAYADSDAGRKVYVAGAGTATLAGSEPMPGTLFPCATCHGPDGRGNAEGGVVAPNVTWLELTKPYRAAANGRRRPPYDEQSLRRAIAEGVDSAGNPLHAAMPRYAMGQEELASLLAYLKVLGREAVPGVTESSVRIGTIVPPNEAGARMAAVLAAYFEDAGEIHGRRIELVRVAPETIDSDAPFALAGGVAGAAVEAAVERAGIPLVLPVSLRREASPDNQQRFYVDPAIDAQWQGLVQFVQDPRAIVVDAKAKLAAIPKEGSSPLLFLGNLLPADFFEEAPAYGSRIRIALTATPADMGGIAAYREFAARHSIAPEHLASQLSAYAAAKVLVHALKRSGRALTRDALRASLESLYEFDTGVAPPLTFGRGRRTGVSRVHVATMDSAGNLVPLGTFTAND